MQDPASNNEFLINESLSRQALNLSPTQLALKYVLIQPEDIERTFKLIPNGWESFQGRGVDLGGGIACVASVIARKNIVIDVHCVEYSEEVVKICQPIMKHDILKDEASKVISVVGNFDNLELPASSMDFAVSWDSIHHSHDPIKTLVECRRVLKFGAPLVIVDRAHNNCTPDAEIARMLDVVYDRDFLKANGLDENLKMTRREHGEHEWRYSELESFFSAANFKLNTRVSIKTDTVENRSLKNDVGDPEIFVPYNLGGFGHRKVGFVLEAI